MIIIVLTCWRDSSVHGRYLFESDLYFYTRNMAHMQQGHVHGRFACGWVLEVLATVRSPCKPIFAPLTKWPCPSDLACWKHSL